MRLTRVVLVLGTTFAIVRFFLMVDRHAVDVLFRDQWSIREPFFLDQGLWTAIRFQHGPHRQGLGAVFMAAVDALSGWNMRAEAFATAACVVLAAFVTLDVKRRVAGDLTVSDVGIPFLFTGYALFELFAVAPNPAHGALPLLLASVAAWLFVRSYWVWIAVVGAIASHTGFALYLAIVLAGLALIEAIKTRRASPALAGGAIVVSLAYFFVGYEFQPAIACFKFPHDRPTEYVSFLGLYLLRPLATFRLSSWVSYAGMMVGVLALGASVFVLVRYARAPNHERAWPIVVLLAGFAVSFGLGSAVGRVCAGLDGAFVSRYVPYALPAWLALYLLARRWWALALCVLFFAKDVEPTRNETIARGYSEPKRQWRACYLRTQDWRACDAETGFPIHFVDEHLDQSFAFMRERGLNVYRSNGH